tara:strand:+ start:459 stop:623 length:165 start_codon:yes stop_codon:yes gene_type:complete
MTEEEKTALQKIWEIGIELSTKETEEEIEYTCCGDEVTGIIADIRICPTCKEHI